MFASVCYFVGPVTAAIHPLTGTLQKAVTVDSVGDDRHLLAILRYSQKPRALRNVWKEWTRRTLVRSLEQHNPVVRFVVGSVDDFRFEQCRPLLAFWRQLEEIQRRLKLSLLSKCHATVNHDQPYAILEGADNSRHTVPLAALLESRVLAPILNTSGLPTVQVPTWNSDTLAPLTKILNGNHRFLNFVSDNSLTQILSAADFLDLQTPADAVWMELARRVSLAPLRVVPTFLAPYCRLRSLDYGQPNELADILEHLAEIVSNFVSAFRLTNLLL